MELTEKQLQILRHLLGIDINDKPRPQEYRDYYCANPNDPELHLLVDLGMVQMYSYHGGWEWFTTTDAGKEAARASQQAMLLPKPKRVYLAWLKVSDIRSQITFKQFLIDPKYADIRRNA